MNKEFDIYTKSINTGIENNFNTLNELKSWLRRFYWHPDAIIEVHLRNKKTDDQKSWNFTGFEDFARYISPIINN